jgi:hypothetical protein
MLHSLRSLFRETPGFASLAFHYLPAGADNDGVFEGSISVIVMLNLMGKRTKSATTENDRIVAISAML